MMMMMKNPIVLATCILLLSYLTVVASQSSFGPNECCFHFFSARLRKSAMVSYRYTDKRCPKEAVIFSRRRGGEICADPSVQYVKDIINILETKEMKNSTSGGSN